ncbi:MAG: hypothetical protein AAGA64_17715 [Bacteroidota bacterium]
MRLPFQYIFGQFNRFYLKWAFLMVLSFFYLTSLAQVNKKTRDEAINKSYFVASNLFNNKRFQTQLIEKTEKKDVGNLLIFFKKYESCKTLSVDRFDKFSVSENDSTELFFVAFKNNTTCGVKAHLVIHKIVDNRVEYLSNWVMDNPRDYKSNKKTLLTRYGG